MKGPDNIPVSLVLDGGGDAQTDGAIEEISRRSRRVLWLSVRDGRRVVYKGLVEQLRSHPEEVAALRKEYLLTLRVDSPGVVSVYGFEEHPRLGPVMVMEYVDGATLGHYLSAGESLPPLAERRAIARGVARAMAAAHAVGSVHRDLKPDNILIRTKDRSPKIIDFGHGDSEDFVIYKRSLGTDAYGAPEQREPSAAGMEADVYSFGRILDELLPERRYRRLRSACTCADPAQRPSMAQVVRRLERPTGPGRMALAVGLAAVAVTLSVVVGMWRYAAHEEMPVDVVDTTMVPAPEVVRQPASSATEQPAKASASVSGTPTESRAADDIAGRYIRESDRITDGYGAITYAIELKPANDSLRMKRAAEYQALADSLDREMLRLGADEATRSDARLRLWTHIVSQTNRIDGVDAAGRAIMSRYSSDVPE